MKKEKKTISIERNLLREALIYSIQKEYSNFSEFLCELIKEKLNEEKEYANQ